MVSAGRQGWIILKQRSPDDAEYVRARVIKLRNWLKYEMLKSLVDAKFGYWNKKNEFRLLKTPDGDVISELPVGTTITFLADHNAFHHSLSNVALTLAGERELRSIVMNGAHALGLVFRVRQASGHNTIQCTIGLRVLYDSVEAPSGARYVIFDSETNLEIPEDASADAKRKLPGAVDLAAFLNEPSPAPSTGAAPVLVDNLLVDDDVQMFDAADLLAVDFFNF